MAETIICNECMGDLVDPIKLNCDHLFCLNCAKRILKAMNVLCESSAITCPRCESITNIEGNALEAYKVTNALPSTQAKEPKVEELQMIDCGLCNKLSVKECLNCSLPFCEQCANLHRVNKHFQNHKILSYEFMKDIKNPIILEQIKQITEKNFENIVIKNNCLVHSGNEFRWYCFKNKSFYCDLCVADKKGLKVVAITNAVETLKAKINFDKVAAATTNLINMISRVEEMIKSVEGGKDKHMIRINEMFDDIIKRIEERRMETMSNISKIIEEHQLSLEEQVSALQILLDKGNSILFQRVASDNIGLIKLLERCESYLKMVLPLKVNFNESLNEIKNIEEDLKYDIGNILTTIDSLEVAKISREKKIARVNSKCIENSAILPLQEQSPAIMKLFPSLPLTNLLYRITVHGSSNKKFHLHCDNKGPLLVLVKLKNGNIFGGYTGKAWKSIGGWSRTTEAYLFRISNTNPKKFSLKKGKQHAIYLGEKYGLVFGQGDLIINFDELQKSRSVLGSVYESFGEPFGLAHKETEWDIHDIEVFSA